MLAMPATTMTQSPTLGLPAAVNRLWKVSCNMKKGSENARMLPYTTHSSSSDPSAPNAPATDPTATNTTTPHAMPTMSVAYTISENSPRARLSSPSPIVLATSAVPPVPNMYPSAPSIMNSG